VSKRKSAKLLSMARLAGAAVTAGMRQYLRGHSRAISAGKDTHDSERNTNAGKGNEQCRKRQRPA